MRSFCRWLTFLSSVEIWQKPHVYSFQNGECASVGSTPITIDKAVSYVLADAGSDIDNFSAESESSESFDDDQPLAAAAIPNNQRGKAPIRRNTIRTSGRSRAALAAKKANEART